MRTPPSDGSEWDRIVSRLESKDLHAVVLNGPDTSPAPVHPRVVDLIGRTDFATSLAVLRRATGYWGIASALCVAAAQIFPAGSLWVKGPEPWLKVNRHVYFAPHGARDCPYLFDHLCDGRPAVRIHSPMSTLIMRKMRVWRNELVAPGSLIEADVHEAETLVATGQAELYEPAPDDALRKATLKPGGRKATLKQGGEDGGN